jgi:hypothetical protein
MVNKFRGIFENLSKDSDFIRFGKLGIQKDVLGGSIIEVIPSPELVETSILLAEEKSLKTMDSNQNLIVRNRAEKINQSCRGILGEAAIQLLFAKQLKLPLTDIKRFDLERDSFDYTSDEYDLRISNIRIEVRTSNNPTAVSLLPEIISALGECLIANLPPTDDCRARVISGLKHLSNSMTQFVSAMSEITDPIVEAAIQNVILDSSASS